MNPLRLFLFLLVYGSCQLLPAQRLVAGLTVAGGGSWEIERLPLNVASPPGTGLTGGRGWEVRAHVGYQLDPYRISFRPGYLVQRTTVFQRMDGDGGMSFEERVYPNAVLLPLHLRRVFGQQGVRPFLEVGGGVLVALARPAEQFDVFPAKVLPYVEVTVGAEIRVGECALSPHLLVRNGTGSMFDNGGSAANQRLGGQRWGYAAVGVGISWWGKED